MQHRALQLGAVGTTWLERINQLLAELERDWNLKIGRQLTGGTEALVFLATCEGKPAVVKLGIPDSLGREARTLLIAEGRGYARLLRFDAQRHVLLLERLGGQLAEAPMAVDEQIESICATLNLAWCKVDNPQGLLTGAAKAQQQAEFMRGQWEKLDRPCPRALIDEGLDYAYQREQAFSASDSYLVHGDAHIWNTLRDVGSPTGYALVDPDGVFGERAIDLAVSLREWRDELLAGDTQQLGQQRCALLSDLTGVSATAIWQWGFVEHVSSGLLYQQLGDTSAADQHFSIASRWAAA